jgi:RNA polymerase sigma factor (sigma-70 family)
MTSEPSDSSREIAVWLNQMQQGDLSAKERLLESARNRLLRLARRMLRDFPGVRRWEETDDIFQNAAIRLCRSLDNVVPDTAAGLMRLAARDIRCALIDLARHYEGPQGAGRNHQSASGLESRVPEGHPREACEPSSLAYWSEFHQQVQQLPEELQAVMDLLWYQELTQESAAVCLSLSERTVQRRWRQACLMLHSALGDPPASS